MIETSPTTLELTRFFPAKRQREIELILTCARTTVTPSQADRIAELAQAGLDWDYLIRAANERHEVAPLIYWQLNRLCPRLVPPDALERLRRIFQHNLSFNLALSAELVKLAWQFEARRIPFRAFKGPTLSLLAYGNLALRSFADLDLLVREEDAAEAWQMLLDLGYRPEFKLGARQARTHIHNGYELSFEHLETGVTVDLHWALLPKFLSFSPSPALVWEKVELVDFGNQPVPALSAEALVLYLCAHASKHNWRHLNQICDLAEFLQANAGLDWDWLLARRGAFGTDTMLRLGLYLAHALFEVELPGKVLRLLEDERLVELAGATLARMFPEDWAGSESDSKNPNQVEQVKLIWQDYRHRLSRRLLKDFIYLKTMEKRADRYRHLFYEMFLPTPAEWQLISLPPGLGWLYYPLRPLRRVIKYLFRQNY